MKKINSCVRGWAIAIWLILVLLILGVEILSAQSFDIPSKKWGISFGNSKRFTGLRFNFRDSRVNRITGFNFTLWMPKKDENKEAIYEGLSLGTILMGGHLRGVQIGLLGIGTEKNLTGISVGVLGVGSGGDVTGVNIGGIGAGAGGSMTGLNIGLFGVGAGESLKWINVGGLGAGAGEDMIGLNFGGLGVGAGGDMIGINIGGLGVGAGDRLIGVSIGGLGAGAPDVQGLTIGGLGVGGKTMKGVHLALGTVKIEDDGHMIGVAVSAFNYIKGTQTGLALGIVNYAYRLKGVQIGLINIVRESPGKMKALPIININF